MPTKLTWVWVTLLAWGLTIGWCLYPWNLLLIAAGVVVFARDTWVRQHYYNLRRRYYRRFPPRPKGPDGSHDNL